MHKRITRIILFSASIAVMLSLTQSNRVKADASVLDGTPLPTKPALVTEPLSKATIAVDLPTKATLPTQLPLKTAIATELPTKTTIPTHSPSRTPSPMEPPVAASMPSLSTAEPIVVAPTPSSTPQIVNLPSSVHIDGPSAVSQVGFNEPGSISLNTPKDESVPALVSQSTINLTGIVISFAGLSAIVWLGLLQHRRAVVGSYNAWARADLRLRGDAERLTRRNQITIDDKWIVALLNHAGMDAIGDDPGIDQVDRLMADPIPAIVGLGHNFQRIVFTPLSEDGVRRLVKRKALVDLIGNSLRDVRIHAIDALSGDLFVADDLAAAFSYLCEQRKLSARIPINLPRAERWTICVVQPRPGKITGR
jgi:hypothetical protein